MNIPSTVCVYPTAMPKLSAAERWMLHLMVSNGRLLDMHVFRVVSVILLVTAWHVERDCPCLMLVYPAGSAPSKYDVYDNPFATVPDLVVAPEYRQFVLSQLSVVYPPEKVRYYTGGNVLVYIFEINQHLAVSADLAVYL